MPPPSRQEVEIKWIALISGRLSREEAHEWASEWVEGRLEEKVDVMTFNALQQLHGFDLKTDDHDRSVLRHGGDGEYMHPASQIRVMFEEWKKNCEKYDADPLAYRKRAVAKARMIVEREQN